MSSKVVLVDYFIWHYTIAPAGILVLLHNYLVGTWHRFLISTHARTLLAPWHRTRPSDVGQPQNIGDKIMNGMVDFYVRILAAIIRLTIILIGFAVEAVITIAFVALLVVWFLWPVIFVWMISRGSSLVI